MGPSSNLLTVREVAEKLHVTERTVYAMVKKRELVYYKIGSLLRFKEEELGDYINKRGVVQNGTKRRRRA